ncbi:unnamed protein product [Caenorhabditis angaria]|uniref:Serine/threonine-protein phosphatase n=1 Tax=Caenorhabditis angaria TaxID=860376 RepID=A0A9P1IKV0_9PELO|nr:unnamed protein product [Caenorhabditis angaria]
MLSTLSFKNSSKHGSKSSVKAESTVDQKKEEKIKDAEYYARKKARREKRAEEKALREWNLIAFAENHFRVVATANKKLIVYKKYILFILCQQAKEQFMKDQMLVEVNAPCTIVGDLHGQFQDLIRILNHGSKVKPDFADANKRDLAFLHNNYVFLGDYVDRGQNSLEVICTLFSLKLLYPNRFILLRGNHETLTVNNTYGFKHELINRLGDEDGFEVWRRFNDCFACMPLAANVGGKILCMHGGISDKMESLNDINKIPRPFTDPKPETLAEDLLWSDPVDASSIHVVGKTATFMTNKVRGVSVAFNEQAVLDFLKKYKLELIVRAHQVQPYGYQFFAGGKMITIFSAPNYLENNIGAFLTVTKSGAVEIHQLKFVEPKEYEQEVGRKNEKSRGSKSTSSTSSSTSKSSNARGGRGNGQKKKKRAKSEHIDESYKH